MLGFPLLPGFNFLISNVQLLGLVSNLMIDTVCKIRLNAGFRPFKSLASDLVYCKSKNFRYVLHLHLKSPRPET